MCVCVCVCVCVPMRIFIYIFPESPPHFQPLIQTHTHTHTHTHSNYLGEANDNIATLAMIETAEAIKNLKEIVQVCMYVCVCVCV